MAAATAANWAAALRALTADVAGLATSVAGLGVLRTLGAFTACIDIWLETVQSNIRSHGALTEMSVSTTVVALKC